MPDGPYKICVLVTHAERGGAQKAAQRIARLLAERKHEVSVWFMYDETLSAKRPEDRVFAAKRPRSPFQYLAIAGRLKRALQQQKFDALISFLPLASTLGQYLAWRAGVPRRIASQRVDAATYSPAMRLADHIAGALGLYQINICVSQAVAVSLNTRTRAYRKRIKVVPNAIEPMAAPATDKQQARAALGLPAAGPLALAVGRLAPQKNLLFLIEALAQAHQVTLVLAGDGEQRAEIAAKAEALGCAGRLIMLGDCTPHQVGLALRAADVFVQPTAWEGQSNALLEALNAGLPIISSDIAPQKEVLVDEAGAEAGMLLPLTDPLAWAAAMTRVCADERLARALSQAAARRAGAFHPDVMAAGFEACLIPRAPMRAAARTKPGRPARRASHGPDAI